MKNAKSDFSYDTGQVEAAASSESDRNRPEGIAVIGMAGFFPGSTSLQDFCCRLEQQESLFIKPPANHFPASAVSDRYGAFLDDVSKFDPEVFKITPLEAEYLDPRQRLLLMSVWHCLEDACYLPEILSQARTDVYIVSEGCPYAPFVHAAEITPYSPTGPSSSSLPNRISHAFKLRGKSIFIDTACSGSLVAVHQAMQALRRNETDYAIVGAANLLFGDEVSLSFLGQESLGIVGAVQACYPFQNEAKGFLPAEGVVTIVLKRLSDAVRDNDNIYTVLLGSHVNHVGGIGSLTMPSAEAQSEAIVAAYTDAGISPATVTYIEAHGASTVLADLEEIQAFKIGDRKLQHLFDAENVGPCKISTIKPNIGHANCVSGLMSLIRVVHCLKQAKKLGIKNFTGCSDRISLDGTRFYINEKTEVWEQLIDDSGVAIPRRAAINNFGAGGVNVHVLLEEFIWPSVQSPALSENGSAYFLALSAIHPEQLLNQVAELLTHIRARSVAPEELENLFISTRTAFRTRLVFRYKDLKELKEKLERYVESKGTKGYYLKRDSTDRDASAELFYKHQQLSKFVSTLSNDSDKPILFELWTLGIEEPIRNFYRDKQCLKRSLPGYPFDMKPFWVKPRDRNLAVATAQNGSLQISPLLHQNTSDLSAQQYTSIFTGDEFFLAEHVVKGQKVLPGVAYLEMARVAVAQATRNIEGAKAIRLRNVVWARPIIVDEGPKTIHVKLEPREDGRIDFEIYSTAVHCQGSAGLISVESVPSVDLEKHQRECTEFNIDPDQCYRAFKAVDIQHGAAFQGIEAIHGRVGEVVARIVLPDSVRSGANQFVLHPSIMDSAFQALLGLVTDPTQATLPFALQELEVYSACPAECWAVVRNAAGWSATSKVRKVDIDVCDGTGKVCVRMAGFATRSVEGELGHEQERALPMDDSVSSPHPALRAHLSQGERWVAAAVAKILRTSADALDRDAGFNTFGLDSVSLTALTNELNRVHGLELDPTLFFEHTTIRQFAAHLTKAYGGRFSAEDTPRSKGPEKLPPRFSSGLKPEKAERSSPFEPIAIVGVSGRFPMAKDVDEFWHNLEMGRDCITEVPADRWDWKEIYGDPRTEENKTNIKWGGFISGVDEFDPLFFGISPKEAELMDPQQRLLMMFVWNTIEDAGYSAQRLSGTNTGIFVATGASGYGSVIVKSNVPVEAYSSTGMVPSVGPNRMSYYLNLHGPSEPIETACSSSLVAIHRAVESIRSGGCDMAIAGGVCTILTPDYHISFSKAGMLCEDGRCKTFSDRANGYVRGEGVGMLFLKKLKDAEHAGDHIYGVILGSAENHGGRTNSLTAPNPKAQADVIIAAHKSGGIDPRTINYIEAHGTGTGLGDPIEINGLKAAFAGTGNSDAYCGVGSVKTNIGHLELAAGVSGVIKVLLQMKHGKLAKSLNCETVNPYIQLDNSPFYIVKEAADWAALCDAHGNELPRRAGISSFGFGGVNAHVVVEEYVNKAAGDGADAGPVAILLSAKNPDRLRDRIQQLHEFLRNSREIPINDIAFTLQVGRDVMDERLALIVDSVEELERKLARLLAGEDPDNTFRGRVDKQNPLLSMFRDDAELNAALHQSIHQGKIRTLSELWVKGLDVDWEQLYQGHRRRRIALPAYPFAKQRYWVANQSAGRSAAASAPFDIIHPLLHQNTSTLREQRYSSTFSGKEKFLEDHVLKGVRILPGVVYLEMARAAIQHATRDSGSWQQLRFQKVAWTSPFTVEQPRKIDVVLSPEADGSISFKVFSGEDGSQRQLHFQGIARSETSAPTRLDIHDLRARCNTASISSHDAYEVSEQLGFKYGPTFRALDSVQKGVDQVAAKIVLPAQPTLALNEYVLHPGVMDAALQASMLFVRDTGGPALPYFLDEIEILRPFTASMWSAIRDVETLPGGGNIRTCDIDVCDDDGNVCVRMKGLSFVAVNDDTQSETAVFVPSWQETAHNSDRAPESFRENLLVLCELDPRSTSEIQQQLKPGHRVLILGRNDEGRPIHERFEECAVHLFNEIKQANESTLVQVVVPHTNGDSPVEKQLFSGLVGMLRSAHRENSKIVGQLVEFDPEEAIQQLLENLHKDSAHLEDTRIRYCDSKRWTQHWSKLRASISEKLPWKDNGIYLVTGGAGALGQLFINEIVERVQRPTILITGRHPREHYSLARLREWNERGARVAFRQLDISDGEQVADFVREIESSYKRLDGILHCAGVIKDNSIPNKSPEEVRDVLSSKVAGAACVDRATRDLPLDFFVLFSSLAGIVGNAGQSDYATANAFMDAYATYRNELVHKGVCSGRTLSVNWPLWKDGGMRVSAEMQEVISRNTGLAPLETPAGLNAFYNAFTSAQSQALVLSGAVSQIYRTLLERPIAKAPPLLPAEDDILDRVQKMLMTTVSGISKVEETTIELDAELTQYGFDSISLIGLADTLNKAHGLTLTPAIFFEHPSIRRLSVHLVARYRSIFSEKAQEPPSVQQAQPLQRFFTKVEVVDHVSRSANEPIAIVGMSGRFPMADDIAQFWDNLANGKDCIREIPNERWDWKEYFGDPRKDGNKTNVKWGGFVSGVDEFDPLFFGISPKEAELMDPNQRLLMEYVWKAIEDAGYSAASLSGSRTAIMVGIGTSGYHSLVSAGDMPIESFTSTGMAPCLGPNRMSYFLNFRGPSEPIETACSSSLIALHRARLLIQNNVCDTAVVGGINTIVTPLLHISFSKAGMLSEDGRCKTFSDKANGYVRGEGVGMLFLKRLRDAEQAGDHIYGVILGSAENHGGHATSLTAPNPQAQAEVIVAAHSNAGVDARSITYIEAHGTGTGLGDPVEINALKTAFKDAEGQCGVGSVKSNIGHLELAAGVAGVIKVLLQLKHKRLVKSLHSETINPYIELDGSPFYILQEARDWTSAHDTSGKPLPRRAGISSFGFGGVNAHVVVEEYVAQSTDNAESEPGKDRHAIVLSAKSAERLRVVVRNLHDFVTRSQSDVRIQDLAYTLQVGRDEMEERIGIFVFSLDELRQKLETWLRGEPVPDSYHGTVKRRKTGDDQQKPDANILETWVRGVSVDWSHLYRGRKPRRLSLPTYPFAEEKYWIETHRRKTNRVHPLIREDRSDDREHVFRSLFSGSEFFLADHVVNGRHVVPGVVYLEMARAAVALATGCGEDKLIRIQNVVWSRPLVVDEEPREVTTQLRPGSNDDEVRFEISSRTDSEASQIHGQGWVRIGSPVERPVLNLEEIQKACTAESFSAATYYGCLAEAGLDLSVGHRGIEKLFVGDRLVLGRLALPAKLAGSERDYTLHPSLMDSAAQCIFGLLLSSNEVNRALSIKPGIPFAVDNVEVFARCEPRMWTVLRPIVGGAVQGFDLDMVNDSGECCVRFEGLSLRTVEAPAAPATVLDETVLVNRSLEFLTKVLSTVIRLPAQRIDVDAPLEKYGIDSLMAVQLTEALEKVFGPLAKTLFFEYQTIRELTGFFVEKHREKLVQAVGITKTEEGNRVRTFKNFKPSPGASRRPLPKGEGGFAIIGLAGRYPGADSIAEFWQNLKDGRDSITEIPADRWDHSLYFDPDKTRPGKTNGKWGGFIRGVDEFDPLFFNISPRDAEYLEPQERLFLQCVYETIEDAGYTRQSLAEYRDASGLPGNVGVFVGVCYEEYQLYGAEQTAKGRPIALSGLPSSIANRVSYFFNFHGPSLALDTMCSSSLTALHLACESLQLGKCDVAVAGGVNVSIHPNKYLMLGQGKFLSSKGRCESFGAGGDGYVPSEGVGAVLLKPLNKAIEDGDHIYGVIRGTSINHGGKTNGFSVPNPNAQAGVIENALEDAGIHPRTFSYLEAHGTGTSLGDPIEIAGLNKVFQKYTNDTQFCAIGSVKSNIGHCESAAGVAGLTKVLLQMQHSQLVPSLHSAVNEAIQFEQSPFVLQKQPERWCRPVVTLNGESREYPLIAGISSFGAGGSNAHVIVEEYVDAREGNRSNGSNVEEQLIVVSARNEDRLSVVAQKLHDFIRDRVDSGSGLNLKDLAYTLQVGREAMDARAAFTVSTLEETLEKLSRLTRNPTTAGIHRSGSKEKNPVPQESLSRWMRERKLDQLAALWVSGVSIDWLAMHAMGTAFRISLPSYPFEKEKYWVPTGSATPPAAKPGSRGSIHPLLHENTSTFSEQRFTTVFSGNEPFLTDHRVNGEAVLPGVAYLEMARAGIEHSSQIHSDQGTMVVRNVVWSRPVIVNGGGVHVCLGLSTDADGRIVFEVYSDSSTNGGRTVYSRGTASLRSSIEPPRLDVSLLKSRCESRTFEPAECYDIFSSFGVDYGPAHRGIEKVYAGVQEALAKLRLPAASANENYLLHPSMMDAALQATIFVGDLGSLKPALPFALDELEIFGPSTTDMWAHLRPSAGGESKVRKLDVDVCDENGKLCARFKGLSSRELPRQSTPVAAKPPEEAGTYLLTPVWDNVPITVNGRFPELSAAVGIIGGTNAMQEHIRSQYGNAQRLDVTTDDTIERIAERIRALPALDHVVWIAPSTRVSGVTDEALITAQQEGVLFGFRLIKALLREGFGRKSFGMTVITTNSQKITADEVVDPSHASIHGLIGTLAKEYPGWRIRLLDLESDREWPIAEMFSAPSDPQGNAIVYRLGEWYKQQLIQFVPQQVK